MAKTSINPESDSGVTSLEVVSQNTSPALPASYNPDRYDDLSRDIQTPVLGLVNKIGPLSEKFPKNVGEFALGEDLLGETVQVIPVAIMKYFVEAVRNGVELKFGSPEAQTARSFATANEAYQAGYAVDYDTNVKNRVEEASRVAFLVIKPEGSESAEFVRNVAGYQLALAKSSYRRGGHRGVFRPLVNHAVKLMQTQGLSIAGLSAAQVFQDARAWTHGFEIFAAEVKNPIKKQAWYEPRIAKGDALPAEVVAWITENYTDFKV